jgi:hypothetical protein
MSGPVRFGYWRAYEAGREDVIHGDVNCKNLPGGDSQKPCGTVRLNLTQAQWQAALRCQCAPWWGITDAAGKGGTTAEQAARTHAVAMAKRRKEVLQNDAVEARRAARKPPGPVKAGPAWHPLECLSTRVEAEDGCPNAATFMVDRLAWAVLEPEWTRGWPVTAGICLACWQRDTGRPAPSDYLPFNLQPSREAAAAAIAAAEAKLGGGETKEAQHARSGSARGARPGVGRARGGVTSSQVVKPAGNAHRAP